MSIKTGLLWAALSLSLAGCAQLTCWPTCGTHTHNASSLVEYLYPNGGQPPPQNALPQLRIPLRVGLAFLPSQATEVTGALDAAHQEELLERIRKHFLSRKFLADITIIPAYYLTNRRGFEGLAAAQRLYGVDLLALVSYDQIVHADENYWSLGYVTIVGAYVLKGDRHDVSTLIDLAVVDPATRSLVLRAGGTDTRHGNTTRIDSMRETRAAAAESYDAATSQLIGHFDSALADFETDVRSGKAAVQVTRKNGSASAGGGGALGWPSLLAMLLFVTLRRCKRYRGTAQ